MKVGAILHTLVNAPHHVMMVDNRFTYTRRTGGGLTVAVLMVIVVVS